MAPAASAQHQTAALLSNVITARAAARLAVCHQDRRAVMTAVPVPTEVFAATMNGVRQQAEYVALVGSVVTMERFVGLSTANLPATNAKCSSFTGRDGGNTTSSRSGMSATLIQITTATTSVGAMAATKTGGGSKAIALEYKLSVIICLAIGTVVSILH